MNNVMNDMMNIIQPLLGSGEFWVLVSFIGFIALTLYYRAPHQLAQKLDERAETISRDLKEAKRLYDEAQDLLKKHEAKLDNLQAQTDQMIQAARQQSEDYEHERSEALSEYIHRQEQQAEARITSARKVAMASLHHEAAQLALGAAKILIREKADPTALMDRGLDDIEAALKAEKQNQPH